MTVQDLITELKMYNKNAEIGVNVNGTNYPFSFGWSSDDGGEPSEDTTIKQSKKQADDISIYVEDLSNDYDDCYCNSEKTMADFKDDNIENDV